MKKNIEIYCTQSNNITHIDKQCNHLATLTVYFNSNNKKDMKIEIELHFYDTMIKVCAWRTTAINDKKEISLKYNIN